MSAPLSERELAGARSSARAARWILALAVLLGLVRFVRLGEFSLWLDEALTWADWHLGVSGGEISNPLGYAIVAGSVELCGGTATEFSLRFVPALVGWLTIPLVFYAFRPLAGGLSAALAALFIASNSWHLYWSQNARFYTLTQAVALLGAALFVRGMIASSLLRTLLGLAITAVAALFHPSAALLFPALLIAALVLELRGKPLSTGSRRVLFATLGLGFLVAAVGAPWVIEAGRIYWRNKGHALSFGAAASSLRHYLLTTGFYVTPVLGAGAAIGIVLALTRGASGQRLAAYVTLCCLALAMCAATIVTVSAQYVFFLLPWIALLATLPVGWIRARAQGTVWAALAYAVLIFLPQLTNCALYMSVRRGERPQWRDAYQYVWNQRGPDDLVLGMDAGVGEFYLAPYNSNLRHPTAIAWLDYYAMRDLVPERWQRTDRSVWFIINPELMHDMAPHDRERLERILREECRLMKVYPLYVETRDLSVWVWLRERE